MSEQIREQMSALMDGELPAAERALLLRRLAAEPELADWWRCQHRAREVLRNEASPHMEIDLAGRVMLALEGDAPAAPRAVTGTGPAWWRPVAGLAVAASVATVAVLGVQQFQSEPGAPVLVAERVSADEVGTPLWTAQRPLAQARTAPIGAAQITQVVASDDNRAARDPRLDAYMASHAEQALMLGSSGWLPYSRMVGQGDETSADVRFGADR